MKTININQSGVLNQICLAEYKIKKYQHKILNIDLMIVMLKTDKENLEALVQYLKLTEKRKFLLIDLFYYSNEYGMPEEFPEILIDSLTKRIGVRDSQIAAYIVQKKRRNDGINFINNDISLLKKIININLQKLYLEGVFIDS